MGEFETVMQTREEVSWLEHCTSIVRSQVQTPVEVTWPRSRAGIDLMPDKINLDYLKRLYCEFQNVVGGKTKNT